MQKKNKQNSIQNKILTSFRSVYLTIAITTFILIMIISTLYISTLALDEIKQNEIFISKRFSIYLEGFYSYMNIVSSHPDVQEIINKDVINSYDILNLNNIVGMYQNDKSKIDSFIFHSIDKDYYPGVIVNKESQISSDDLFEYIKKNPKNFSFLRIQDKYYKKSSESEKDVKILSIYQPIYDYKTGRLLSILECNITNDTIESFFSEYSNSNSNYALYNEGVSVITTQEGFNDFECSSLSNLSFQKFRIGIYNNKLIISNKLELPIINCEIVGFIEVYKLLSSSKYLALSILLINIVGIFLIYYYSKKISQQVSTPIIQLNHTIKKIQQGNMQLRTNIVSDDEIGQLSLDFNSMLNTIENLINENAKKEKLRRYYEVSMIQNQINPHFLYNSLESINALSAINKPKEVSKFIKYLSSFYRTVLSNGKNIITVEDEVKCVANYLNIQLIRFSKQLSVKINYAKEIKNCKCVKMILQPLVENCIVHGFKGQRTNWKIIINGYLKNGFIFFEVIDNGKGIISEELLKKTSENNSFGLQSIITRGVNYYGVNFSLKVIEHRRKGSKIVISFKEIEEGE